MPKLTIKEKLTMGLMQRAPNFSSTKCFTISSHLPNYRRSYKAAVTSRSEVLSCTRTLWYVEGPGNKPPLEPRQLRNLNGSPVHQISTIIYSTADIPV